jgi:recombination protein RecA
MRRTPVRTPVRRGKVPKLKVDSVAEFRQRVQKLDYVDMVRMSDPSRLATVRHRISTRSLPLDRVIGGGIPTGKVTEIYGPEGVGKSALADSIIASCQQQGGYANLADTEHTRDLVFSKTIGVDVDELDITQFGRGKQSVENVFNFWDDLIEHFATKDPDKLVLLVWDAVAGTSTNDELKGDVGDSHAARPAAMLKRGMRRIIPKLAGTKIAVVLLNHQYTPVGFTGYGPKPLMVYGGKGIAYLATIRMRMFRMGQIKDTAGVVRGNKIGIKMDKLKTGSEWGQVAELGVMHGIGIDNVWTIYETMKDRGLITTGGGWSAMQLEGESVMKWQGGFLGLGALCRERTDLFDKLARVYGAISPVAAPTEDE